MQQSPTLLRVLIKTSKPLATSSEVLALKSSLEDKLEKLSELQQESRSQLRWTNNLVIVALVVEFVTIVQDKAALAAPFFNFIVSLFSL